MIRSHPSNPFTERTERVLEGLREGLGAQDVLVRHGVPEDFYRHVVATLEATGRLRAVLRGQA